MKYLFIFSIYIILSAYGLYKIKLANEYMSMGFVVGMACYFIGFIIWFYILKITPLSVAFPVAAGGLIIATTIFGVLLLNEAVDTYKIVGASLIIVGITFMSLAGDANGA